MAGSTNPTIPTAVTPNEVKCLQRLAKGHAVLEIGSLLGFSTIALARAAQIVVAVDPHEGYPQNDPRPTLKTFLSNIRQARIKNIIPIIGRGQDVIPLLGSSKFGLVFVDTMGDFAGTSELMSLVRLHLSPTTLAVHDYGHPVWTGATAAIDQFGIPFALTNTLAVFQL